MAPSSSVVSRSVKQLLWGLFAARCHPARDGSGTKRIHREAFHAAVEELVQRGIALPDLEPEDMDVIWAAAVRRGGEQPTSNSRVGSQRPNPATATITWTTFFDMMCDFVLLDPTRSTPHKAARPTPDDRQAFRCRDGDASPPSLASRCTDPEPRVLSSMPLPTPQKQQHDVDSTSDASPGSGDRRGGGHYGLGGASGHRLFTAGAPGGGSMGPRSATTRSTGQHHGAARDAYVPVTTRLYDDPPGSGGGGPVGLKSPPASRLPEPGRGGRETQSAQSQPQHHHTRQQVNGSAAPPSPNVRGREVVDWRLDGVNECKGAPPAATGSVGSSRPHSSPSSSLRGGPASAPPHSSSGLVGPNSARPFPATTAAAMTSSPRPRRAPVGGPVPAYSRGGNVGSPSKSSPPRRARSPTVSTSRRDGVAYRAAGDRFPTSYDASHLHTQMPTQTTQQQISGGLRHHATTTATATAAAAGSYAFGRGPVGPAAAGRAAHHRDCNVVDGDLTAADAPRRQPVLDTHDDVRAPSQSANAADDGNDGGGGMWWTKPAATRRPEAKAPAASTPHVAAAASTISPTRRIQRDNSGDCPTAAAAVDPPQQPQQHLMKAVASAAVAVDASAYLQQFYRREVERRREQWLSSVRNNAESVAGEVAPPGSSYLGPSSSLAPATAEHRPQRCGSPLLEEHHMMMESARSSQFRTDDDFTSAMPSSLNSQQPSPVNNTDQKRRPAPGGHQPPMVAAARGQSPRVLPPRILAAREDALARRRQAAAAALAPTPSSIPVTRPPPPPPKRSADVQPLHYNTRGGGRADPEVEQIFGISPNRQRVCTSTSASSALSTSASPEHQPKVRFVPGGGDGGGNDRGGLRPPPPPTRGDRRAVSPLTPSSRPPPPPSRRSEATPSRGGSTASLDVSAPPPTPPVHIVGVSHSGTAADQGRPHPHPKVVRVKAPPPPLKRSFTVVAA